MWVNNIGQCVIIVGRQQCYVFYIMYMCLKFNMETTCLKARLAKILFSFFKIEYTSHYWCQNWWTIDKTICVVLVNINFYGSRLHRHYLSWYLLWIYEHHSNLSLANMNCSKSETWQSCSKGFWFEWSNHKGSAGGKKWQGCEKFKFGCWLGLGPQVGSDNGDKYYLLKRVSLDSWK